MSKKLLQYYQGKMQTGGKVLPLYADGDPVPARYAPIPRASSDMRRQMPVIGRTADEARVARAFNNGAIRTAQPQNRIAKALAVAANPATAASYAVKGQRIPDNFDRAETNRYDVATSVVNPFSYLKQVVDTKRDLEEGNYSGAALNAMGILPTRLPNFGRITSANLDGFLGKQLNNVSRQMEHLRGKNNEGVFMMRNRDDIVVKLEDANRTAHFTDTPEFANTNMAEKMRDIPDNLPISKTLYQLDDVRLKNYQAPMRASFMKRVTGVPGGQLEPSQFVKIPDKSYQELYSNLKTLRNNDLAFDYFGNNYLYNPNTQQFGLFDIGLQPKKRGYWADDVYGASSKELFGMEASGKNIKDAIREKMSGDFRYTMEPEYDAFYDGASKLSLADLQAITAEGSRRVSQRVKDALANMNYFAEGGPVDPPVRDNTYYRVPVKQYVNRDRLRAVPTTADNMLRYADIATDVMQAGNFIPHPIGQAIGKAGNVAGAWVDGIQAGRDVYRGDYGSAAINAGSAMLPSMIKNPNIMGGYRRSAKYNFGNRSFYTPVDKLYGRMTQKQLMGNRALLGALGAESVYDTYEEGGEPTLMRNRRVGTFSKPLRNVNLRPVYDLKKPVWDEWYVKNCPDGVGCSKQATMTAQAITGLPYNSYAPADAGYRDAVAKRSGLKNVFDQDGKQKTNANSRGEGWKYPSDQDFRSWKAGDIVTLDAGNDIYYPYSAPRGFSEKDNSGLTHNGTIYGFDKSGRPIIKHGYQTGRNRGKSITEVLNDDGRVSSLGHGKYAIKSVWRPREVNDDNTINTVVDVVDDAQARATRKKNTTSNQSFYVKNDFTDTNSPADYFSGAVNRSETKQQLVDMFNNEELDKELQYKLGMTADEVDNMKPVIYGVFGQETNFNDVDSIGAASKELIGSILGKGSRGPAQIKLDSLSKDERKVLGIKRASDLEKEDVSYKAAMLLLNNARRRMNMEVEQGTHPELQNADEYFRAGYYYNSPARAVTSAKEWGKKNKPVTLNPLTWFNKLSTRERPGVFASVNPSYAEQAELRMDKGSYPYKLMEKARDLGVDVDFENAVDLEEVVVRGAKKGSNYKKLANGGLLTRTVSCSNCGHSWKSVEGGIDPLTCHKCGGMVKMKDGGQHGGLDRWFAEKWVDVKSGKPCGRQEGEDRAYPACRPSRRVNSGTPKTSSEMSPAEKAKFKREKTSSQRISYNHQRNK
jgi:hypothetical protein